MFLLGEERAVPEIENDHDRVTGRVAFCWPKKTQPKIFSTGLLNWEKYFNCHYDPQLYFSVFYFFVILPFNCEDKCHYNSISGLIACVPFVLRPAFRSSQIVIAICHPWPFSVSLLSSRHAAKVRSLEWSGAKTWSFGEEISWENMDKMPGWKCQLMILLVFEEGWSFCKVNKNYRNNKTEKNATLNETV